MPTFDFHGLALRTESALDLDPAALLLAPFPRAAERRETALVIETRARSPGRAENAGGPGPPVLVHGDVRIFTRPDGAVVVGPGSALRVSARGDRIWGEVTPGGEEALWTFANVDLFLALALALRTRDLIHLHAGATVSTSGQVLLLAGTGGSGKSTLTAALAAAGHAYLGDDVIFLAPGGGLLAFPRPFHLSPESARAVAVEAGRPRAATGKADVDPRAAFPSRERWRSRPPDAILLPEIAHQPATQVEPLPAADGLGALIALSAFAATRLAGAAEQRSRLARLAEGARVLRIRLGRDLLEDAAGTALRIQAAAG